MGPRQKALDGEFHAPNSKMVETAELAGSIGPIHGGQEKNEESDVSTTTSVKNSGYHLPSSPPGLQRIVLEDLANI